MFELAPNTTVETCLSDGDGPGSETAELARALRLVLPSLRDHKAAAVTIRMMLRKRGVEVVHLAGVPFQ